MLRVGFCIGGLVLTIDDGCVLELRTERENEGTLKARK